MRFGRSLRSIPRMLRSLRTRLVGRRCTNRLPTFPAMVLQQFLAMLLKDVRIARRSKKRCACELLVPLFVLPILVMAILLTKEHHLFRPPLNRIDLRPMRNLMEVGGLTKDQFATLNMAARDLAVLLVRRSENATADLKNGVHFTVFEPDTPRFEYEIPTQHVYIQNLDFETGWVGHNPYASVASDLMTDDVGALDKTIRQWVMNKVLINMVKKGQVRDMNRNATFEYLPSPMYKLSLIAVALPFFFIFIVLSVLIPMAIAIKDLVTEIETEIKTYLMVMGMTRLGFYLSHLLFSSVKVLFVMLLIVTPLAVRFSHLLAFAWLVWVTLAFAFTSVVFALLCATLFRRSGLAISAALLGWLGLSVVTFSLDADRTQLTLSCVYALNPVAALRFGLDDLTLYEIYDSRIYNPKRLTYQFTIFHAIVLLHIDAFLLFLITQIIDYIATSGKSLQTILASCFCCSKTWKRNDKVNASQDNANHEDFEPISQTGIAYGICVRDVRKKWPNGEVALSGATFKAYRDQVTTLLGHNGAGKSTMFSCLTGFTRATSGFVEVNGIDVSSDLDAVRKNVGYCPQDNPLFDRLTCLEHLYLVTRMRGTVCSDAECQAALDDVMLSKDGNTLAENLSGGMKRKLCVAMTLITNAKVILLDEPTAGMDLNARKQIDHCLEKAKVGRTILLTTHYMADADQLSDRILIMVKGRVTCGGSSAFLKQRFGTGFLLTVTLRTGVDVADARSRLTDAVRQFVAEARVVDEVPGQITLNLPSFSGARFSSLFAHLEAERTAIGVEAFGLSVNTLEQVFISVGERAENRNGQEIGKKIAANAQKIRSEDTDRQPSLCRKMCALCWRNLLYLWRHPIRTAVPFLVVIVCFIFLYVKYVEPDVLDLAGPMTGEAHTTRHSLSRMPRSTILSNRDGWRKAVDRMGFEVTQAEEDENDLMDRFFNVPPNSLALFDQDGRISLRGSRFLYNSPLLAISMLSNLLFDNGRTDNIVVSFVGSLSNFKSNAILSVVQPFVNALVTCFGLTFAMAMMLSDVITERAKKFKHQLYLSSAGPYIYWTAQLITDFAYFATVALLVLLASAWALHGYFTCSAGALPIWALYFLAASLASYVLSFLFESPTKGTVFIVSFHTIVPMVTSTAVNVALIIGVYFLQFDPRGPMSFVMLVLGVFFPAVSLFRGQTKVVMNCVSRRSFFTVFSATTKNTIQCTETMCNDGVMSLAALVLSSIFYLILLVIIEKRVVQRLWDRTQIKRLSKHLQYPTDVDEDVDAEEKRLQNLDDSNFSLSVRNLFKLYSAKKCAVQNLTFGMGPNDCFGLLGPNGAGKTSTFDVLTNQSRPTSGRAAILGEACERTPPIGYCPQFDALSDVLTGAETLRLLGQLNGFRDVEARVRLVLECVMLEQKADRQVKTYSGGQKRRLSIAAALISGSGFLILDEPTAGVDPATRRQIWDLLTAMREQNKAILLTTHSMEECEALCTRIGFLRAGRLRGIGTSQHLKSRFGNTYLLTLILTERNAQSAALADRMVRSRFAAQPTDSSVLQSALTWTLPRDAGSLWSEMYAAVNDLVDEINRSAGVKLVNEFYLVQDSLEQVFTRLAYQAEAEQSTALQGPSKSGLSTVTEQNTNHP